MLNRTLTVYNFPDTLTTSGIFILIMSEDFYPGDLHPEDLKDLYNDFHRLKDFVDELVGLLYDDSGLPNKLKEDIYSLYMKKFG